MFSKVKIIFNENVRNRFVLFNKILLEQKFQYLYELKKK